MEIRLIPSPSVGGLIVSALEAASKNCTSATVAQLRKARRSAPTTSLPDLMFDGGKLNELENETMSGLRTQRCAPGREASRDSCEEDAAEGTSAAVIAIRRMTMPGALRII